jgi:hypothetical protein
MALALLSFRTRSAAADQEQVSVTDVTPSVLVFATSSGNVVASVGPDGALLIGTPSTGSTDEIEKILRSKTSSAFRYVVIYEQTVAQSQGDAGWGKRGAFVTMHESALERLGGHTMGPPRALPQALMQLGVDRPRIAFSDVITFDMNGESVHVVHQPSGYNNADALAHFHVANLVYMGEVFPGDGYPDIDREHGGSLDGLLEQLAAAPQTVVVPARGKVTNGAELEKFHDMITGVRTRVRQLIAQNKTEEQVIAAHPSGEFDATWGHGRVQPDAFVREVYLSLKKK